MAALVTSGSITVKFSQTTRRAEVTSARTVWRFSQVEAEEMVGLWAIFFVTHDQLSSLSTAVAVILMGLFALSLQLALLGLEFSIAHLLFPLHNHCTLQEVKQGLRRT